MFRIENITKKFDESTPIHNLSVTIKKGDVIAIIGPSGTGKSTFLRCLNMLDGPTEGKIFFKDEEITAPDYNLDKLRMKVGMVFQSFNLFNHLTAIENVMMPQIRLLSKSKQEAYDKGMELLDLVGLKDKYLQYPTQLSGGQKQRVAFARAMAMEPEVMLLDEPTSALDPTMVDEVDEVITNLASSGMTILMVTHDMRLAKNISNKVFYMDEGIVYEQGTPEEIFDEPKKAKTIQFIKKLNIIDGTVTTRDFDTRAFSDQLYGMMKRVGKTNINWHNTVMILDELVNNILFTILPREFNIKYAVTYDKDELSLSVDYSGDKIDIQKMLEENAAKSASLDNLDDPFLIPLRMINSFSKNVSYNYDPESELPNHVEMSIKSQAELFR